MILSEPVFNFSDTIYYQPRKIAQNSKMLSATAELNIIPDGDDDDGSDDDMPAISSSSVTGASESKTGHEAKQDQEEKEMRDKIIKSEEKAVKKGRLLVIGAFIACATAVSVAVYKFASKADFRSFELEVSKHIVDGSTCVSVYFKTTRTCRQPFL
jgi:hypothetical protein